MPSQQQSAIYEEGCHCGRVRFQVEVKAHRAVDCNCSICRKKGFLHLIVLPQQFTLLQGEDALTTYRFNTQTARHLFCRFCGIHSFYHPRSHPQHIDVNLCCLDSSVVSLFEIETFDGEKALVQPD